MFHFHGACARAFCKNADDGRAVDDHMGKDRGIQRISTFYQKTEDETDDESIKELLGIHVQQTKKQCADEGCLPFAKEVVAAEQDTAGENFFQNGRQDGYGKHGNDQT